MISGLYQEAGGGDLPETSAAREDADGLEKGSKKSATTARQHGIVNTVTKRLRYFAEMS